jgi:hypothetical protein
MPQVYFYTHLIATVIPGDEQDWVFELSGGAVACAGSRWGEGQGERGGGEGRGAYGGKAEDVKAALETAGGEDEGDAGTLWNCRGRAIYWGNMSTQCATRLICTLLR